VVVIKPRTGLLDLDLKAVWRHRELLFFLVWRELKVRYSQAALGAAWAIVQPLFTVMVFTAIFGVFARIPSDGVPYAVFAFAGVLPWTYFAEATRRSALGLVGDSELVRKIYFPRLIIPLSNVIAPLVDFAVALVVFLVVMAWYGIWPTSQIAFVPILLLMTTGLSLAMGLWLGPVNVRFRDITHTLPFLLQVWMFATPIVYPLSMVPERWRDLYSLNPMVGIIDGFRWALLGKGTPDLFALGVAAVVIVCGLAGGLVFFRRAERSFADVI
jgi:lipopolysaccharide transport system permease protein